MKLLAVLFLVAGVWKATWRMPDGFPHDSTFDLQVSGDKLTGKITSKRGTVAIENGAVNGNDLRFTVIRRGNGDEITVEFTGKVDGDTMKLKMKYRDRVPVEITAKRAS